jgi:hypothetical protein
MSLASPVVSALPKYLSLIEESTLTRNGIDEPQNLLQINKQG